MLTLQEKQKLMKQLQVLKERKAELDKGSSKNINEGLSVSERLKNLQKNQIRLQSKIARMMKNGTILQNTVKGSEVGKPGKVMMDKKVTAKDATNTKQTPVGSGNGVKGGELGKPGKVMLDKDMKAKDVTPATGKYKETKAYEGFDPDLLECIKRRDAWDKLANHYIYEADDIYNDSQSPFQSQEDDDFNFDVDIDADGQQQGQEKEGEDEGETSDEKDIVQELKVLNQKINDLKTFMDSITPEDIDAIETQQSKLQQIVDKDEEDGEEGEGEEQGEEGFDMQGGESQGIEGLEDEEALSLQGSQQGGQGSQQGGQFNPQGGQQGGQNFKGELGADALSNMKMGGANKKKKSPEIAMEDVREAILRRNFWDATAKNLIRLEEYCNNLKEASDKEIDLVKAGMGIIDSKEAAVKTSDALKKTSDAMKKQSDEVRRKASSMTEENDSPFLPPEAIRVELSSDSGVDNSSVGELSTTETCACGVPECKGECKGLMMNAIGTNMYPTFTNESDKKQIELQKSQIKQLQEELKKVKSKK